MVCTFVKLRVYTCIMVSFCMHFLVIMQMHVDTHVYVHVCKHVGMYVVYSSTTTKAPHGRNLQTWTCNLQQAPHGEGGTSLAADGGTLLNPIQMPHTKHISHTQQRKKAGYS